MCAARVRRTLRWASGAPDSTPPLSSCSPNSPARSRSAAPIAVQASLTARRKTPFTQRPVDLQTNYLLFCDPAPLIRLNGMQNHKFKYTIRSETGVRKAPLTRRRVRVDLSRGRGPGSGQWLSSSFTAFLPRAHAETDSCFGLISGSCACGWRRLRLSPGPSLSPPSSWTPPAISSCRSPPLWRVRE